VLNSRYWFGLLEKKIIKALARGERVVFKVG